MEEKYREAAHKARFTLDDHDDASVKVMQ